MYLFDVSKANIFNDPTVSKSVQNTLKESNIEIYENYLMDEWHSQGMLDANQPLDRVKFRSKDKRQDKELTLKCTVNT